MARRRISLIDGMTAVEQVLADAELQAGSPVFTTAVRFLLEDLAERIPGNTVEVRVPPLGATQCVQGPAHRRG
jgi:Bacterial SCP ortholog